MIVNGSAEELYVLMVAVTQYANENPGDTTAKAVLSEIEEIFAARFDPPVPVLEGWIGVGEERTISEGEPHENEK